MLTTAVLSQRSTTRGWRLTQLARSYVWYGRNEPEKGEGDRERKGEREGGKREREREWKEGRRSRGDREAQRQLIQTDVLLFSCAARQPFYSAAHTERPCHSLPAAAHMKWQQARALSQQAAAATGMVAERAASCRTDTHKKREPAEPPLYHRNLGAS